MKVVSQRVSIVAPQAAVFAYATDPSKMGHWLPYAMRVLGKLAERVVASRDARVFRLALENAKDALET